MLKPVYIEATDINDAWFQLLYNIFRFGRKVNIDKGSFAGEDTRLEYDWVTCRIKYPGTRPLAVQMPEGSALSPPTDEETIEKYFIRYLMSSIMEENEVYTYGSRLVAYKLPSGSILDQVNHVIETYRQYGWRNNQMILTVGIPDDLLLEDPACLRHIDTRIQIEEDGEPYLHFFPYFRSNDLMNGFPTNIGGIQLLKEFMAGMIGVNDGEIIYSSKGLHLYGTSEEMAKMRLNIFKNY